MWWPAPPRGTPRQKRRSSGTRTGWRGPWPASSTSSTRTSLYWAEASPNSPGSTRTCRPFWPVTPSRTRSSPASSHQPTATRAACAAPPGFGVRRKSSSTSRAVHRSATCHPRSTGPRISEGGQGSPFSHRRAGVRVVPAAPTSSPRPAPDPTSRSPLVLRLALAALILAPAVFWRGGVLEEETIVFLDHYLDQRSVLEKVFDPRGIDFDNYQARELSYFVDLLDAQVFKRLLRTGRVLLIPLSAVTAALLTWGVWARRSARPFPGVSATTRSLLLLVLFTNYVYLTTMGLFYRATKPMLVPVLLGFLFYVWRRLGAAAAESDGAAWDFVVAFVLGSLMSAFDRQGFFYVVVASGGLGLFWLFRRRGGAVLLGSIAAAGANTVYNYLLGPWLIHAINGYGPRFKVQRTPIRKLIDPQYYLKAAELLPGYAATLFGGLPVWLFLVAAALTGAFWVHVRRSATAEGAAPGGGSRPLALLLLLLFATSQIFMFGVMVWRYPMVYDWTDHRLWYFPWPFQALLVFGLLVLLSDLLPRLGPRMRRVVHGALVLVAVAHVAPRAP